MTDNELRLQNIIDAQQKASHEWRKKADLDYVQMQRMYYALIAAYDFIEEQKNPDEDLLLRIMDAYQQVEMVPPEVFK